MITSREFRKITDLKAEREHIRDIIDSFTNQYVKNCIGIVSINSASQHTPKQSEVAQYFHNEFKSLVKELNSAVLKKLRFRVKEIDLELTKYIKPEKKK